jgi:hypothetical protein
LQTICGRSNFRESELKNFKMIKPISDCFLSFSTFSLSLRYSLSRFLSLSFPSHIICPSVIVFRSLSLSYCRCLQLCIYLFISLSLCFPLSLLLSFFSLFPNPLPVSLSLSLSLCLSLSLFLSLSLSFYFLCHSLNLFISLFLRFPPSLIDSFSTSIFSLLLYFHIICLSLFPLLYLHFLCLSTYLFLFCPSVSLFPSFSFPFLLPFSVFLFLSISKFTNARIFFIQNFSAIRALKYK